MYTNLRRTEPLSGFHGQSSEKRYLGIHQNIPTVCITIPQYSTTDRPV